MASTRSPSQILNPTKSEPLAATSASSINGQYTNAFQQRSILRGCCTSSPRIIGTRSSATSSTELTKQSARSHYPTLLCRATERERSRENTILVQRGKLQAYVSSTRLWCG